MLGLTADLRPWRHAGSPFAAGFCPPALTAQSATDFGHLDRLMDATEQPLCATLTELQYTEAGLHNGGDVRLAGQTPIAPRDANADVPQPSLREVHPQGLKTFSRCRGAATHRAARSGASGS